MAEQLYGPDVIAKLFEFDGVRRVDQLVQDGIITPTIIKENGRRVRKYDLIPTVQQYIRYLKDKAERKNTGTNEDALAAAEADLRYKQARAQKMEMEIAELRGQLHRSEDVATLVSDMIAKIRAGIMAIPGMIAVDCAEVSSPVEAGAIIKAAVDEFLNDTAKFKYDPAEYKRLVKEREKWLVELEEAEILSDKPSASLKSSGKGSKPRKT